MRYDLVIFDLDGTILNTLDDLAEAANRALTEAGYAPRPMDDIRRFIGNGVAKLIRRALPPEAGDDEAARVLASFKAIYLAHVNDRTVPYPGIPELLDAMGQAGVKAAVNSNKVHEATKLLCDVHFGRRIAMALGEQPDIPRKPAPDGAFRIMGALNVQPGRTLYVGDGDADILTAKNAGIDAAWVSWGYRRREELAGLDIPRTFDTVEALRDYIGV